MLYEKIVPKDLAEFTGERLRQSLFFYKITTRVTRTSSKKTPAHVDFSKFCEVTVSDCLCRCSNSQFFPQ